LGSGLDTFALAFPRHRPPLYWTREYDATPTKAHNDLLHALATQGLVGGVAWCLVAVGGIGLGLGAVRRATGRERGLATALLGGWVAFLVHVQASFAVVALTTVLVAWAVVLAGLRAAAEGAGPPAAEPLPGTSGFRVGALAATLAFALGLASDGAALGPGLAAFASVAAFATSQAWAVHRAASGLAEPVHLARAAPSRDASPAGRVDWPWSLARAVACLAAWVLLVPRPFAASVAAHRAETAPTPRHAVAFLTTARDLDPLRVTWRRRLGLALARTAPPEGLERLEQAREVLLGAARLVPADAYGWASLVETETRLAAAGRLDREQPFRSLEEAVRLDPANVTFRMAGANAALELGLLERARRYAGEAASLLPAYGPPRAQLAHVAAREGRPDDAIRLLREALASEWYGQVDARHAAQANLASLLSRERRFADALAVARALVAEAPLFAPGRYQLARALEGLGRTAEAAAEYGAALRLDPGHRGAAAALGALPNAKPHSK
jgi:tetratricopeptide (TPR) repeat protein